MPTPSAPAPSTAPPRQTYRADIDGLRAIAVLAVVLTHADIQGFSGGYLGVDIFFVISGYLIHSDLVKRFRENRFSLVGFYGRRTRRTLPALYVVGLATLIGAAFVLMPGDFDEMARSLIGAVLLVPNIVFLTQTGYFDQDAVAKPLLHTWSLGVEEQFYLLAPLLPFALVHLPERSRRLTLLVLFGAALAGCLAIRAISVDAAFYLMPSRIFEFLVGAIVAERMAPGDLAPWQAEIGASVALGAILGSITLFTSATPHPGLMTLIPCIATAAIIQLGSERQTIVASVLGWRPFAFVGLISYSLYLWHWPLIAFARYSDWALTPARLAVGAVALFALSVLSWRFVEAPFRDPVSVWRRRAPAMIPAGATLIVASCAVVLAFHGVPARFPREVASISAYYAYRDQKPFREGRCFITSKNSLSDFDRSTCLALAPDRPNVLLLGDSHAAHLWTGLRDTWPDVNFLQATASGCKPVIGTLGPSRCTDMMRDVFDRFIPGHRLDAVVLAGLWDDSDIERLKTTIAALDGHVGAVVVFGPMPRYDQPLATILAKGVLRGDLAAVPHHLVATTKSLDATMRKDIAPLATYISTYDAMCPDATCRLFAAPGVPMQFDYHHLTPQGVDILMAKIKADDGPLFGAYRSTSKR